MRIACFAILLLGVAALSAAQEPEITVGGKASIGGSAAAIAGSKENPEAVARGGKLFEANCSGCHGLTAKGTNRAPDLIRSLLVLDDEKGILIAPVIHNGRPAKGMPKFDLTEAQVSDIVAWLHVQTYAADHRATYVYLDVVTGDPKKGEAYFNGPGGCKACHSPTGDLKGIASKYDPHALQNRWLQPRSVGRGGGKSASTVTVTLASGEKLTGTLDRLDDFNVAFHDAAGDYHSINRNGDVPKIEVHDPLRVHVDLLKKYTDADIHNLTAYLVTLK
ncbi:MAG: cytochrome c [Acidobacteriota bacterium]|nr:cytochrome c [Acidobacteriota bacterium]